MTPQEHTIIGRDMIDGVLIHFGAGCCIGLALLQAG